MRKFIAALIMLVSSELLSNECPIQGATALWAISYCMAIYETDDEAHPDVNSCFIEERKDQDKKSDMICSINIMYKSAMCSLHKERGLSDMSVHECVQSKSMVPTIVRNGGI